MDTTYRATVAIHATGTDTPSFSMTSENLSREQLDGFLCRTGSFYDQMVNNPSGEDEPSPSECKNA